ncbi:hypothetical protein K457DRAFT_133848 [Linnemannia elongata AG-77]|uniref:Uncharacterized protein n=1 Tax=Linnemannia elongata AG-77 TaxID=1314771 RepID=A0A197KC74_9FUNG|nr:hypothetical protein K457DRAFT_133848 [Linnemannia elongata AG-77]
MVSARTTTVLLGLTAATSLFFLSTTALPVVIPPQRHHPYDSLSSSSSSASSSSSQQSYGHFYAQDHPYSHSSQRNGQQGSEDDLQQPPQPQQPRPYPQEDSDSSNDGLERDTHEFQTLLLTRPSSAPLPQHHRQEQVSALGTPSSTSSSLPSSWSSSSSSSSLSPPHSSFVSKKHPTTTTPSRPSPHQHNLLRVHTFNSHGPILPQDQILHQCTTHFLALLDTEISDRLMAQLSRLVMMLPVIGVETRAVIRTKVGEVMGSVVGGLKHYDAIERVIRSAVDDAGGLQLLQLTPSTTKGSSLGGGDNSPRGRREDDLFVMDDSSRNDQISEYDDVDDVSGGSSGETTTTTTGMIDESQIPVITDIAMEAVLDYMAEILTPSLVIHQLTEAIQGALFEISKQRKALQRIRRERHNNGSDDEDGYLEDVNEADLDLDDLSSQAALSGGRLTADRHGVDLLSDGWVWSGPSSRDKDNNRGGDRSITSLLEEDEEDEDDDPRGQDEDLWGKDMETHQWDSTGRLFEDFDDDDNLLNNESSQTVMANPSKATGTTEHDIENWNMAGRTLGDDDGDDGEGEEEDESSDPYSIGIRDSDEGTGHDNDNGDGAEDEDGDDPMADTSEDYGRERYLQQSYFNRFQKRSLFAPPPSQRAAIKQPDPQKPAIVAAAVGAPSLQIIVDNPEPTPASTTTTRSIHRPNLTPDLRLENLLTQLIEPLLTTFIEEDFPASCKRVQGELMDGIIWSLDQSELNGGHDGLDSDEERMLLLSELEY